MLGRFSETDRARLGVHTCPGGDRDSTHSANADYTRLLPDLFTLKVGNFYIQLASEQDRPRVLGLIKTLIAPSQRVFIGVTDPIDRGIETPDAVRDRVLEAAKFIPVAQLGTTDDCGFAPFADDTSTARQTAFAKIPRPHRGHRAGKPRARRLARHDRPAPRHKAHGTRRTALPWARLLLDVVRSMSSLSAVSTAEGRRSIDRARRA